MSTTPNLGLTVNIDKSSTTVPGFVDITEANMGLIDTAMKKMAMGTRENFTIAANGWSADATIEPYTHKATVGPTYTIGNNTVIELENDQAVLFATYGFAILSATQQGIVIGALDEPEESVTLSIKFKEEA